MTLSIFSRACQPSECNVQDHLLCKNKCLFRLKQCLYHLLCGYLYFQRQPLHRHPQVPRKVLKETALGVTWSMSGPLPALPTSPDPDRTVGPAQIQNRAYTSPGRAPGSKPSCRAFRFSPDTLLPWKQNSKLSSRGSQQPAVGIQAWLLKSANHSKGLLALSLGTREPGKYSLT